MTEVDRPRTKFFSRERIEYWSLIAEIVAAAAVVVSLVFVGVQLRSANVIAVRDEANATMLQWSNIRRSIYSDETVAEIFNRGLADPASLDETERVRFDNLMTEYSWGTWHIWDRIAAGLIPESHWEKGAGSHFLLVLCTPGGRESWQEISVTMPPGFADAMNDLSQRHAGPDGESCNLGSD
ncbi:hypothetical protein [Erythrobacter aurantius]|uniref:hypothetical protein n=1 Tax=Erythrobacter aurantius TaxID=2909249 RepID=UPI0020792271|nr:hypothetical protein [Erythrobacter aurantius]